RVKTLAIRGDRIVLAGEFNERATLGEYTLRAHGLDDMLYAELGLDGRVMRAEAIGGLSRERVRSLTIASDGSAVVSGSFGAQFEYGGTTLRSRGAADGLVIRVHP